MSNLSKIETYTLNGGYTVKDLQAANIVPAETPAPQLAIFVEVCKRTQLDPMQKQIYLVNNKGKFFNIVSIDGARLIAHRTGLYVGKSEPMYDKLHDGTYKTKADYQKGESPKSVTITVKKVVAGIVAEFTASIAWSEYMDGFMHKTKPFTMADKTAEMHALRMAFPELGQLYSEDEISASTAENQAQLIDTEEWSEAIKNCKTKDELRKLYSQNKEVLALPEFVGIVEQITELAKTLPDA